MGRFPHGKIVTIRVFAWVLGSPAGIKKGKSKPNLLTSPLKELYFTLVLFSCSPRIERA